MGYLLIGSTAILTHAFCIAVRTRRIDERPERGEPEKSMKTEPINVMLVEDNDADAKLVRLALAKAGDQFNVNWAGSLSAALVQMTNRPFDVALVDLALPDSNGLDTVLRIRRHSPQVPIVLLTGNDSDETAIESLDQGAQDYLVKDRLIDHSPTDILKRSIRYAIHRQKTSETQRLLDQLEGSHKLLKAKNRRLAKLCKTAERFVENVSHEFRTPLTVIKEYTSLIRGGLLGPVNPEQSQFLNVIENRTDDLNRMVDDMLDGSRLDAGLLVMSRSECATADIVDGIRQMLLRKAESRGLALEFAIEPDLPAVYCDPEKIGRVIVNLVVNAIKFCGESGNVKLWVRADEAAGNVVVSVIDNGRGMDAKHLEAIFGRFKQVGKQPPQSTSGFGLGLSIAKELVDLSFGQLTVESELQKGSTFTFTLPVADPIEIVARSLNRLAARGSGPLHVSLLTATALAAGTAQTTEDLQSLLNDVLRADDLLFRVEADRWIIVLAADSAGVEAFCSRVAETLEAVNRNRPRGALPPIEMMPGGSWQVRGAASEPLAHFARLMQPADCLAAG
jgi:signal transduction histidine kinase